MAGQRPNRSKIDPVVDMMRRIERLERTDAHPDSTVGITTDEIGEVEPTGYTREGTGWSAVTRVEEFFITADPDISIGADIT